VTPVPLQALQAGLVVAEKKFVFEQRMDCPPDLGAAIHVEWLPIDCHRILQFHTG
jgi:hypothetical protein